MNVVAVPKAVAWEQEVEPGFCMSGGWKKKVFPKFELLKRSGKRHMKAMGGAGTGLEVIVKYDSDAAKVEDLIKAVQAANGPHGPYDTKVKKK